MPPIRTDLAALEVKIGHLNLPQAIPSLGSRKRSCSASVRYGGEMRVTRKASQSSIPSKLVKQKKPRNAFFLYRCYIHERAKEQLQGMHQNDLLRALGARWHAEPQATKDYFYQRAREEKERCKIAWASDSENKKVRDIGRQRRRARSISENALPTPPATPSLCRFLTSPGISKSSELSPLVPFEKVDDVSNDNVSMIPDVDEEWIEFNPVMDSRDFEDAWHSSIETPDSDSFSLCPDWSASESSSSVSLKSTPQDAHDAGEESCKELHDLRRCDGPSVFLSLPPQHENEVDLLRAPLERLSLSDKSRV